MKIITLFLTCTNDREADRITDKLLAKKSVTCVKKTKVSSKFLWKGKTDNAKEILLIMDSLEEKFAEIEKEVRKSHSYQTFVLLAVPVIKSSQGVEKWINEELKS